MHTFNSVFWLISCVISFSFCLFYIKKKHFKKLVQTHFTISLGKTTITWSDFDEICDATFFWKFIIFRIGRKMFHLYVLFLCNFKLELEHLCYVIFLYLSISCFWCIIYQIPTINFTLKVSYNFNKLFYMNI